MLTYLRTAKQAIDKYQSALKEDFPFDDYAQVTNPVLETAPFPHIVIDNLFKEEVHEMILEHFTSALARGFSEENDPTKFHPFLNLKGEYKYDGYVYVPRPGEKLVLDIFFSMAWNLFFSRLFRQSIGWCTSLAYHYHPAGDRTGFVHHDYAPRTFSAGNRLSNGVISRESSGNPGIAPDTELFEEMRAIALLYYLGDSPWQEGDGGETGLYESKESAPVKLVAPKNNRLLAFQISRRSFHAFQQNFRPRSAIVQWFHTPTWDAKKEEVPQKELS